MISFTIISTIIFCHWVKSTGARKKQNKEMVPENLEVPSPGLGGRFSEDPSLAFWHGLRGRPSHHHKWNILPLVKKQWMMNLYGRMATTQQWHIRAGSAGGSHSSALSLIPLRSVHLGLWIMDIRMTWKKLSHHCRSKLFFWWPLMTW